MKELISFLASTRLFPPCFMSVFRIPEPKTKAPSRVDDEDLSFANLTERTASSGVSIKSLVLSKNFTCIIALSFSKPLLDKNSYLTPYAQSMA
ncbi:hypothetical protein [Akkermansia muciniphila]|uniref:hypothetical protein n=1 Tax=Akkermansia muciniphila TaxID=239935 RepID=UPI001F2A74ED|nr:hypothetical protein [Akkermansia muciniphila]